MALLHYENLGVSNPHAMLRSTCSGLGDFYKYLTGTLQHLESEHNVLRLAWTAVPAASKVARSLGGFWVELGPPSDRPNEPEPTFDAFLDEGVGEVFEVEPAGSVISGRTKRVVLSRDCKIGVVDRDRNTCRMLLSRGPRFPELCLRPSTSTLRSQLDAIKQLQNAPSETHVPLLRLFEPARHARWPELSDGARGVDWQVLTDESRPGTHEQRRFVDVALRTPDFALLEGPPGSGKTTAICELILQLVEQGKRVLLCASTHVAVDNVLERIAPFALRDGSELVAVRVGDRSRVSEKARPFQLECLMETERERLIAFLSSKQPRSSAQEHLLRVVSRAATRHASNSVERMILDAANVVCGTTAGILRHPDIENANASQRAGMFDMLILDEASKTTFQEFLVPALLARTWIIVGDVRQLSPFVDEDGVAANLRAVVPDPRVRDACVDVFLAGAGAPDKRRSAAVVTEDDGAAQSYQRQASARGVVIATSTSDDVGLAQIVLDSRDSLVVICDQLPADLGTIRGELDDRTARRARAYRRTLENDTDDAPCWEQEMAWRLCRGYELRQSPGHGGAERLAREVETLLPVNPRGERNGPADSVNRVRRVAFPSILESLQEGFERQEGQRDGTALTDGLPRDVFAARHVLLEFQHRMHPDISAFPRLHVYQGKALRDPSDMASRHPWPYARYQRRAVWLHVDGHFEAGRKRNRAEADAVVDELAHFRSWAQSNQKPAKGGPREPWEVAVLTFYRGQERELRTRLRKLAGQRDAYQQFELRSGARVDVRVELRTVDSFQGHEADLVFLSIANTYATSFLASPNRMNVALTRARCQRVIIGNRRRLQLRIGTLLYELAMNEPWELPVEGVR